MILLYGLFLLVLLLVCPAGLILLIALKLLGSILGGIKG